MYVVSGRNSLVFEIVRLIILAGAVIRYAFFGSETLAELYLLALGLFLAHTLYSVFSWWQLSQRGRLLAPEFYGRQVVIDTLLISLLFFSTRTTISDTFMFYFLPLMLVATQVNPTRFAGIVLISLSFVFTAQLVFFFYLRSEKTLTEVYVRDILPRFIFFFVIPYVAYELRDRVIEQARKIAEQSEELDAVNRTALYISEKKQGLSERLEAIVDAAIEITGAKGCKLYLPDPRSHKIRLEALKGLDDDIFRVGILFDYSNGIVGEVMRSGIPVLENDYKTSKYRMEDFAHLFDSLLEVPLLFGGETIGVLGIFDSNPNHRFKERDQDLLGRLARHAAVAIHEAQLHEALQKKSHILETLSEASNAANASLDMQDTLNAVAEYMWNLALIFLDEPPLFSCVLLLDQQNSELVIKAAYSTGHLPNSLKSRPRIKLQSGEKGLVGKCLDENQVLIIPNVSLEENYLEYDDRTMSQLVVPIVRENYPIGVISVEHQAMSAFPEELKEPMKLLSSIASVAIDSAALFSDRTEMAVLGLVASAPKHQTGHLVSRINDILANMHKRTEEWNRKTNDESQVDAMRNDIERISRITTQIYELNDPIVPSLFYGNGELVCVSDWLASYSLRFSRYTNAEFFTDLPASVHCWVSIFWLDLVADILLENARQAVKDIPDPKVRIAARQTGDVVEIEFRDNGGGIDPITRDQLLRRRVNSSTGSGMGLLMGKMIITTYHGDITITPETEPSSGASFSIVLPIRAVS